MIIFCQIQYNRILFSKLFFQLQPEIITLKAHQILSKSIGKDP